MRLIEREPVRVRGRALSDRATPRHAAARRVDQLPGVHHTVTASSHQVGLAGTERCAVVGRHAVARQAAACRAPERKVVVFVPAHNEQDNIGGTIESLLSQSRRPDQIVVVADNCTDATVDIAASYAVTIFSTSGNTHKKAGALNQALGEHLPRLDSRDVVLVMDADSALDAHFLHNALRHVESGYAAVGGTFTGRDGGGFLGMLQRNEYARYARDVSRRRGKALVLTGTATALHVRALRDVLRARAEGRLPGASTVYDTRVLTEDNELTLALLHLGWPIIAPAGCLMTTEVMTSWGDLYRQRLRWKRGAIENLVDYGLTAITLRYWVRQFWSFVGLLVTAVYLLSLVLTAVTRAAISLHPLWLIVTAIFAAERVVSVRGRGPSQMLLSAFLVVEMPYDIYLQGVHGKALFDAMTRRQGSW